MQETQGELELSEYTTHFVISSLSITSLGFIFFVFPNKYFVLV